MAGKIETIWNETKALLVAAQATGGTLSYIKQVYEGYRDNIPHECFPCLILEPVLETDKVTRMPVHPELHVVINIHCLIEVYDPIYQIIGNDTLNIKGVMDIVADVKNVLWQNTNGVANLNGSCQDFSTLNVSYNFDKEIFPFRIGIIELDARILTTQTGR